MSFFIQIGAGAGDQDERSNYEDGFTSFVKKNASNKNDKVLVVEANPLNLDKLKFCWSDYSNIKILNLAIVDSDFKDEFITLFYTEEDKPCYQVTSIFKDHVKKHYPNSKIEEIKVKSKNINDFLFQEVGSAKIEYLAIDAEGIDFNLIMDLNFNKFEIMNISIEFLHFDKNKRNKLINKLIKNGYSYYGKGFDINGYDLMFRKKMNFYLKIKTKYFLPK
tara:strand:+ start:3534 stop:4193 length:660 start_codon:yes stop_codon:yes gene_type:complete